MKVSDLSTVHSLYNYLHGVPLTSGAASDYMFEMIKEKDMFPSYVGDEIATALETAYRNIFRKLGVNKGKAVLHQAITSKPILVNLLKLLETHGSFDGDMIRERNLAHMSDCY